MRNFGLQLTLMWGFCRAALAQTPLPPSPESLGFRQLLVMFGRDSVRVLVKSPQGAGRRPLPLLLWVQGSQPIPLILYDQRGAYPVLPFEPLPPALACHLAIISKPGIPLAANIEGLNPNRVFGEQAPPPYYCQRNYLAYYVRRNTAVLRYLKRQPWVDKTNVTVAGHSEGSTIAAHLAAVPGLVSRAAYLSGDPLGRLMSELTLARQQADSAAVRGYFRRWRQVVAAPDVADCLGDDPRNESGFGPAPLPVLLQAKVPVFVGFGSRDRGVAGDDYLRLETIRRRKTNFTFREYPGREHNFFGFKDGQINYDDFYWDKVGEDFLRWAGLLPGAAGGR